MLRITRISGRNKAAATLVSGVLLGWLALAPTGTAFATAAGPASCMGHEASNLSPPGSSEELPSGMPAFSAFFRENFPGTPAGAFISGIAQLREGSHEACDEALGE
jgi:hypothetical protein